MVTSLQCWDDDITTPLTRAAGTLIELWRCGHRVYRKGNGKERLQSTFHCVMKRQGFNALMSIGGWYEMGELPNDSVPQRVARNNPRPSPRPEPQQSRKSSMVAKTKQMMPDVVVE